LARWFSGRDRAGVRRPHRGAGYREEADRVIVGEVVLALATLAASSSLRVCALATGAPHSSNASRRKRRDGWRGVLDPEAHIGGRSRDAFTFPRSSTSAPTVHAAGMPRSLREGAPSPRRIPPRTGTRVAAGPREHELCVLTRTRGRRRIVRRRNISGQAGREERRRRVRRRRLDTAGGFAGGYDPTWGCGGILR
jgi:hypothetical protein